VILRASTALPQVRGTNGALLVIRDSTIANTRQGAHSNALVLSATNGVPGLNTPVQATVTRSTIALGTAKQTTAVLGGRISRTAQPRFMPYASVDVSHSSQGDPMATVSSEAANVRGRFGSGKVGNAYKLAAGVVSQVSDRVQLYGEGNYQHFVGGYGMRGWAGNVGLRVSF